MIDLPIDVIPNSSPPRFVWRQVVGTPVGTHVVAHEGNLPSHVEGAVVALVVMVKRLVAENDVLRGTINMTVDRLGGQVEGKPTHEGNFLQRIDELVGVKPQVISQEKQGARKK